MVYGRYKPPNVPFFPRLRKVANKGTNFSICRRSLGPESFGLAQTEDPSTGDDGKTEFRRSWSTVKWLVENRGKSPKMDCITRNEASFFGLC